MSRALNARRLLAAALAMALALSLLLASDARTSRAAVRPTGAGWITDRPSMLTPLAPGSSVQPILTVGDTLPGGFRYESIPDGISLTGAQHKRATALINHETSAVPFPFVAGNPDASFADFVNAEVSELTLKQAGGVVGVKKGSLPIPSEANYQRFCSNFLAGETEGFDRPLLLTNEEATDWVYRSGRAWRGPYDASNPPPGTEQAGVVVVLDPATGNYRTIYGMGRHNHENSLPVPGYGHPVVLSGDDTFSAPGSQVYMYEADDADAVWNDEGSLWAFRSSDPSTNDYGDLTTGEQVSGEFIPVPRDIAVGPQGPLESWSNANNVFQFIRVEDMAYDRSTPNVVYFLDTAEPRAIPDATTGRLRRGPSGTRGPYMNGRIFKMVLDPTDPTQVDSLSVLLDADTGGYNNPAVLHQPDNIETTDNSLLVTEDPGSHNQGATTARVWRYDLASSAFTVVAAVNQSQDPAARKGEWEPSGIVDASAYFGPGAFLVNVQAHTLYLETDKYDADGDGTVDVTRKREGGQLLLFRLPGA